MLRLAVALVVIGVALSGAAPSLAQDEPEPDPAVDALIETARQRYRPPGLLRRCAQAAEGEIVVCAPDPDKYRVESPTAEAIRTGVRPRDEVPRAPELAPPPCDPRSLGCFKFGAPPPMPPMVDVTAFPEPLTPEEAARVFRAEGAPSSAAASPEEAR